MASDLEPVSIQSLDSHWIVLLLTEAVVIR